MFIAKSQKQINRSSPDKVSAYDNLQSKQEQSINYKTASTLINYLYINMQN